jgi:hypothetical protein
MGQNQISQIYATSSAYAPCADSAPMALYYPRIFLWFRNATYSDSLAGTSNMAAKTSWVVSTNQISHGQRHLSKITLYVPWRNTPTHDRNYTLSPRSCHVHHFDLTHPAQRGVVAENAEHRGRRCRQRGYIQQALSSSSAIASVRQLVRCRPLQASRLKETSGLCAA